MSIRRFLRALRSLFSVKDIIRQEENKFILEMEKFGSPKISYCPACGSYNVRLKFRYSFAVMIGRSFKNIEIPHLYVSCRECRCFLGYSHTKEESVTEQRIQEATIEESRTIEGED